jgi:hypothetical protein
MRMTKNGKSQDHATGMTCQIIAGHGKASYSQGDCARRDMEEVMFAYFAVAT